MFGLLLVKYYLSVAFYSVTFCHIPPKKQHLKVSLWLKREFKKDIIHTFVAQVTNQFLDISNKQTLSGLYKIILTICSSQRLNSKMPVLSFIDALVCVEACLTTRQTTLGYMCVILLNHIQQTSQ